MDLVAGVLPWMAGMTVIGLGIETALARKPWTGPAVFTYLVIAFWYLGNVIQVGLLATVQNLGATWVDWGFIQIIQFAVAFRILLPLIWPLFRPTHERRYDATHPLGYNEESIIKVLARAWAVLTIVGLYRVDGDLISVFIPPLSDEPKSMFGRGAVGSGLDFLVSVAGYSYLAVGGLLGAVAVLANRPNVKLFAGLLYFACLFPSMFQHARHQSLAILMPGVLAFVLIKQWPTTAKLGLLAVIGMFLVSWFSFVTAARTGQVGWDEYLTSSNSNGDDGVLFVGLEMFDELCHINRLKESGAYSPGFCGEYFEQTVIVVPRTIWPGKPLTTLDYTIARGFYDPTKSHMVSVTLCLGLIGQGVANCGTYAGPVVSALLAAVWAAILTRMWAQRARPARLGLYLVGIAVTVNMGRGFSLLALFPFIFAYLGIKVYETMIQPSGRGTGA